MNEWGFIGQDTLMAFGKSTTSFKIKSSCGYVRDERLVLSISTHHSWTLAVIKERQTQ
jgi:hypothetical protein